MRIFVTGATGFIGSAIVQELIGAGHQVLGLTRSDAGASLLRDIGAEVHRGDLNDLESLRKGAAMSDGVIHTAFNHDFSTYIANCESDRDVIEALGSVLMGSDRRMIVTCILGIDTPGRLGTEEDAGVPSTAGVPRNISEETGASLAERGLHVSMIRLPPAVHDTTKQGLVSYIAPIAREKGVSAYVGDGQNRWPAVHRLDAARLFRLAFENGTKGAKYHAIGEQGVALRDIAEALGRSMTLPVASLRPEEAGAHFGWLAPFMSIDRLVSSALTQQRLEWQPTEAGLIADIDAQ